MTSSSDKSADAFRTISEVAKELDLKTHVLRFWESKFPQIKPLKRAGGRRYYRPDDVDLLRRLQTLLHDEGYTIKGVQKLLREEGTRKLKDEGAAEAETVETPQAAEIPLVQAPVIEAQPQSALEQEPVQVPQPTPQAITTPSPTELFAPQIADEEPVQIDEPTPTDEPQDLFGQASLFDKPITVTPSPDLPSIESPTVQESHETEETQPQEMDEIPTPAVTADPVIPVPPTASFGYSPDLLPEAPEPEAVIDPASEPQIIEKIVEVNRLSEEQKNQLNAILDELQSMKADLESVA